MEGSYTRCDYAWHTLRRKPDFRGHNLWWTVTITRQLAQHWSVMQSRNYENLVIAVTVLLIECTIVHCLLGAARVFTRQPHQSQWSNDVHRVIKGPYHSLIVITTRKSSHEESSTRVRQRINTLHKGVCQCLRISPALVVNYVQSRGFIDIVTIKTEISDQLLNIKNHFASPAIPRPINLSQSNALLLSREYIERDCQFFSKSSWWIPDY